MNLSHVTLTLLLCAGSFQAQGYYKLSGPLTTRSSTLAGWELTPDGLRVVFDRQDHSRREIFSAPLDGGAPVALTGSLAGSILGFASSPLGDRVVVQERIGPSGSYQYRLYSVAVNGGTPVLLSALNEPLIYSFRIAPTGTRVVYLVRTTITHADLWSAPLDGSAPPVKLTAALPPSGSVDGDWRISNGGSRVLYRADQDADGVVDLFSVPTDGSLAPVRLNVSQPYADVVDFQISFDNFTTVYRADQDTDGKLELFITSTLGGTVPVKRSGSLVAGGNVTSFQLAAADHRMVFLADAELDERVELYAIDPTVPGARVKLSGSLANDRDVRDARVSADGMTVAYRSDQDVLGQVELYGVPATGGVAPAKLNGPLEAGESIQSDYVIESSTGRVLFHRNMGFATPITSLQLYSAPADGSQAAVRLNGELAELGSALLKEARSSGVLFTATDQWPTLPELFRGALDGSTVPVRLSASGSWVTQVRLTANGEVVVFQVYPDELFAMPYEGGESTRIAGSRLDSTIPYGGVEDMAFSNDGVHAVYRADDGPSITGGVYSARLDGSGPSARLTSNPGLPRELVSNADGSRVVYRVYTIGPLHELRSARVGVAGSEVVIDRDSVAFDGLLESVEGFVLLADGESALYWVSSGSTTIVKHGLLDASAAPTVLLSWPDEASVHVSPDQSWIVLEGSSGLHGYPLDGHQAPQRLDFGASGFAGVAFTPDSSRVLFSTTGGTNGLFSALVDGSQPAVPIVLPAGTVGQFELTSGGAEVLFVADTDQNFGSELYRAPVDGSTAPTLLAGGYVAGFQEDPTSGRVVYSEFVTNYLYSVPVQGGVSPTPLAYALLEPLAERPFLFSRGRVVYTAYHFVCGGYEEITRLYSVPVDGSQPTSRLDFGGCSEGVNPRVELVESGHRVLFAFRRSLNSSFEVYRAPIDASSVAQRIDGPDYVRDLRLSRDEDVLLCLTTHDTYGRNAELFAKRMRPWTRRAR